MSIASAANVTTDAGATVTLTTATPNLAINLGGPKRHATGINEC